MSLQKELCLICERPTADGAVLAVHVDKEKLQEWFLNVCGYELAEELEDEDKICYFCVWHADFQWKFDGMSDETLVWWNLDFDDAAKELRKHYFEGNVEQCWVQLEVIQIPDDEKDQKKEDEKNGKKCFYCMKVFSYSNLLNIHLKKTHKDAIRCENLQCATYFHTIEEREKHNEKVHENPRERKIFICNFCGKEFKGNGSIRRHVHQVHREFPVKCTFRGCVSFFKTRTEMKAHFDSLHKNGDAKMFDCEYCEYNTKNKSDLQKHVARKHRTEKPFKCDKCGEMFSTKSSLANHISFKHVLKRCKICTSDVSVGYFTKHIRIFNCVRCKNQFRCSGLYQSHLKMCRETLLKCTNCPKSFQKPYLLVYHMKRKHGSRKWRGLKYKALGFKCEPCKRYYKSAVILKQHFNSIHNQAKLKYCAHCPKSFNSTSHLKNHLAEKHNLLDLKFECNECGKKFCSKYFTRLHMVSTHFKVSGRLNCRVCGKSIAKAYVRNHLLQIHDIV